MSIYVSLSGLSHFFPSQFPVKEEDKVLDIWERILIHGEGFDPISDAINNPFKAYLITKKECGGNFVKFCDQFSREILNPLTKNLKSEESEKAIRRTFIIVQELAKRYIENDEWGVHETVFNSNLSLGSIANRMMTDGLLNSWLNLIEFCLHNIKETVVPKSLQTMPVFFSRYKVAWQCEAGGERIASSAKVGFSNLQSSIDKSYQNFLDNTLAATAKSFEMEGKIDKDAPMKILEIKSLQTHRMASTIVRVASVASLSLLTYGLGLFFFPFCGLTGSFILASLATTGVTYAIMEIIKKFSGTNSATWKDVNLSCLCILAKIVAVKAVFGLGLLKLFDAFILKTNHISVVTEREVSGFIVIAVALILFALLDHYTYVIPIALFLLSNLGTQELEKQFYAYDFQPAQEGLSPILDPLSSGITTVLDFLLSLS